MAATSLKGIVEMIHEKRCVVMMITSITNGVTSRKIVCPNTGMAERIKATDAPKTPHFSIYARKVLLLA